jgi:hypothetical protein
MKPSVSDSYLFGYNNQVGFLLILLLSLAGAIWAARCELPFNTIQPELAPQKISRRTLAVSLLIVFASYSLMYWFTHGLGGFGESRHMLEHVKLVADGKVPFRDFGFDFGLILLYGPILLSKFLHMGVVDAYYLLMTTTALLGVVLLYAVINWIDYPSKHRSSIFLLYVAIAAPLALCTGIQYTLFRYVPPIFCVLIVHRVWMRASKSAGWQALASFLTVLFTAIILLISPEIGIAYAAGSVLLFTVYGKLYSPWRLVTYLGMLTSLAAVIFAGNKIGIFDYVRTVGGGGSNFPIIPAPSVLLLLFCIGITACYTVFRFKQGGALSNTMSIIAVAVPGLAGALGRCDSGHIALNAVGILLVGGFIVSNFYKLWPWYRNAFLLFFIVYPFFSGLWLYKGEIRGAAAQLAFQDASSTQDSMMEKLLKPFLVRHFGKDYIETKLDLLKQRNAAGSAVNLFALYPHAHGIVQAPFTYTPNGFSAFHSPNIDEGYYFGLTDVLSPKQVAVKIKEMQDHSERDLLLPENFKQACEVDVDTERHLIDVLFFYPYIKRAVHQESIIAPLCSYITDHYVVMDPATAERLNYGLWVRQN